MSEGDLGTKPFAANGFVDSELLIPKAHSSLVVIYAVPDQIGNVQLFLVDKKGRSHAQGGFIAGPANEANIVELEMPVGLAFSGVLIRYTNTNATGGVVYFAGSSAGGY